MDTSEIVPTCDVVGEVTDNGILVGDTVNVSTGCSTIGSPVGAIAAGETCSTVATLNVAPVLSMPTCCITDKVVVTGVMTTSSDISVLSRLAACFL